MKHLLRSILLIAIIISISNISFSQDNASYDAQKRALIGTQIAPEYTPRPPVRNENNIMFLSNCPPSQHDRLTCLKEPFDSATWLVVPFTNGNPPAYRNDDGSSALIPLGFNFNLYGTIYTSVYINNNGNLTFSGPLSTFTPSAFPSTQFGAIVAPFFADVDTRNISGGIVYYKLEPNRLTVTWDSVGYFNQHVDLRCTFQCIISDGTDPFLGIGNNVCFSYGVMQWTTGDASLGIGGFGPPSTAATIGVNEGNGIDYATLGRFCRPGTYYGGPNVDTNGVSYLDCQNYCLNASNAGNICPVAQNFPGGNVNLTVGNPPYNATYAFAAPEIGQITTGGVSGVPQGMSVNITNGLTCTFDVTWDPTCVQAGTHVVCFTGIDNATDPCTTTVCVTYVVDCPLPVEMSAFTSSVGGRNVLLDWTTATELNNARFEIERSQNNEWTKIGEVAGNGTTTSPRSYSYFDKGLNTGTYNYRLKQIDYNGSFEYHNLSNEVVIGVPNQFELVQNYPNPFNPTTKIDYSIPYDGNVSLTVYDAMGKEVTRLVNASQPAGYYSINFNASDFASGIYYYRIDVNGQSKFTDTKKMLLLK
ncbi:MAG: T9SS type A sorting domain-containing protein [Ignavibacteriae bacterium]|nr:T9SS type A sorting domain-containing protein [Ignavibacteriota bacterium]